LIFVGALLRMGTRITQIERMEADF
jgi:hypothetical protein